MGKREKLPNPFKQCNLIKDKEQRIHCKFKVLHNITVVQDLMNLDIRKEVNDSTDSRWIPIHIIDDANAIILETSLTEGRPTPPYINEKVESLDKKVFMLFHQKR